MAKNEKYWDDRKARQMWGFMNDAEMTADQVSKIYLNASKYLQKEIDGIFSKYMAKHGLTDREAKKLLQKVYDKTSIREALQKLQGAESDDEKEEFLQVAEAPAYQARIRRLESLQDQIDLVMKKIYDKEKKITTRHYTGTAKEAYFNSVFEIQKQVGLGFSFSHIDEKQVKAVMESRWSGMNYSERIWHNTVVLAQELKEQLTLNLLTGRTEREAAQSISKKFAQGSSNARRLIRTESCYLSNQLEMRSYKECGIEEYRYLATLDLRTSEICRTLDGKVFLVSEAKPGKNCPPMHPWCRSTTMAVVSEEAFRRMQRRARDPVTGKTYLVPASMNYREWYAKHVEKSSNPAIIRVEKTTLTAEPNTVTEVIGKKGGIDRNYYGPDGKQEKQISNNDHGNPKLHSFGKHGEHVHDYIYASDGKLKGRPMRELTDEERKENEDIL